MVAVNLVSRSRIKKRNRSAWSPRFMTKLRPCWGTQAPVGWAVIPREVHAAGAVFDHHEDVEAAQEDGVDVSEVDGEDRVCLRRQELSPGRAGPSRSGIETGGFKDLPDGGGGDTVAESDQLALDTPVAPGRVFAGHPQYQGPDRLSDGRAPRSVSRVGPAAADEVGMPAQQRPGRHSRSRRRPVGSSLLSALRTARSTQVRAGRGL
jgi:hypothetical protein